MTTINRRKARKRWPLAISIARSGRYASVSHCPLGVTVELFESWGDAERAKRAIDDTGCGAQCVGLHDVVRLP